MDEAPTIIESIDHPPPPQFSDLVRATQFGRYSDCRQLLESNLFDINQRDSENATLLHWAAINNQTNIVDYYIAKGADINAIGGDLMSTPLQWAVRQGYLSMVVQLIKYGADYNIFDGEGFNSLHLAAQFGHTPIVAYLVAKGMDVNLPDTNGMTALMWSVYKGSKVDPTRLLITLGSSLKMADHKHKNTALHWAIQAKNLTAITLLLEAKADIEVLNGNNESPIDMARKLQSPLLVQMLESRVSKPPPNDSLCKKLQKNELICDLVRNLTPFFAYLLIALVIDSGLSALAKIFCLIGIVFVLYVFLFSKALHGKADNFPVAVCLTLAFWLYFTVFFYLFPCK